MESILRSDNDSVVVYLSPTKALVNQVEAEILARFEKKFQPGKVLTGVFTRDFRKNEKDCQILVTVPECLELLLLSMDDPGWQRRIKVLKRSTGVKLISLYYST
jgi:superfamily II RNA helicase